MPNTKILLNGFELKNPIITASGTFGFGEEYNQFFDVSKLGGISSKGLTLNPKEGNGGKRAWETASGMLNSVGLQNPGVKHFIEHELVEMKKYDTCIIANLGGSCEDDYLEGAELLDNSDADIIELNISCPNVKSGGMAFGIQEDVAFKLVSKVRQVIKNKPMMVKLSPNAENIVRMAKACESAGADSISLVNTLMGMAIDIYKKKPVFNNTIAGFSGPAIKPVALRMVYQVCKEVTVPVVGMGGISNWMDAIEFIMAGATAIQVGTANFIKPDICLDIIGGIEKYMIDNNIQSLEEIRGII